METYFIDHVDEIIDYNDRRIFFSKIKGLIRSYNRITESELKTQRKPIEWENPSEAIDNHGSSFLLWSLDWLNSFILVWLSFFLIPFLAITQILLNTQMIHMQAHDGWEVRCN